jgi:hypothetical protein
MRFSNQTTDSEVPQTELPGTIRKLWVGEAALLRDHLLRLDPESRRSRFGSTVNAHFVDAYVARAITPQSVVLGYFEDGTLRAAAELRPFGKPFPVRRQLSVSSARGRIGDLEARSSSALFSPRRIAVSARFS